MALDLTRRSFVTSLIGALAAPAIIKTPGLLMPTKPLLPQFDPRLHNVSGLVYVEWAYDRKLFKWRQVAFDSGHWPVHDPLGVLAPAKSIYAA